MLQPHSTDPKVHNAGNASLRVPPSHIQILLLMLQLTHYMDIVRSSAMLKEAHTYIYPTSLKLWTMSRINSSLSM